MKRLLFFVGFLSLCISCKEPDKEDDALLYNVKLNLSNIRSEITDLKSSPSLSVSEADTSLNKLNYIYYAVFDATGKFEKQIRQSKPNVDFGIISDQLKQGDYTIILMATGGEIVFSESPASLTKLKISTLPATGDFFFKKMRITVSSAGVNTPVTLERIVGYLELNVEGTIEDNIAKIELVVDNEIAYYNLESEAAETAYSPVSRSVSENVTSQNRSSFKLGMFILNDRLPLTVYIRTTTTSNVVKSKMVSGIQIEHRKKTSLIGKLSDLLAAGTKISINDAWLEEPTVIRF